MSISVVTSPSNAAAVHPSDFTQRKKNLDALASALESGDLDAAQAAFSTIQQDSQNMPKPPGGARSGALTQMQNDFDKIGEAIKSGDVNAAKEALDAWKQDLQQ